MGKEGITMLKRMGRISVITLLLVLALCATALASTTPNAQDKILIEKAEITDTEILFTRAINNISDIQIIPEATAQLVNTESSTKLDLKIYPTAQLLKEVKKADGTVVSTYAFTVFATLPDEDFDEGGELRVYSTLPDDDWDEGGGLRAYSTVYYDIVEDQYGMEFYDLYRVTGGWDRYDSTYSLSGREVRVGLVGGALGGGVTSGQVMYKYPTTNSFSYNTPSSWKPANPFQIGAAGCTTYIEINRFGEKWDLTLNNNLPPL
jgi:hypothetical protein